MLMGAKETRTLILMLAALLLCGCSKMGRGQGRLTVTTPEQTKDVEIWVSPYSYFDDWLSVPKPVAEQTLPLGVREVSFVLNAGNYLISYGGMFPIAAQVHEGQETVAHFDSSFTY